MISLSQLSRPVRLAIFLLAAAGIAGVIFFTAATGFGVVDTQSDGFQAFDVSVYLVPATVCILMAVLVAEERIAWAAVGVGLVAWAGGYAYYLV